MKHPAFVLPLALLAACAAAGTALAGARTITVSGTGIITTVPNQAQFGFGVSTTGADAQAALSSNASRMNRVIAALKGAGVRPSDIQTAEISLTPNTNQNGTRIINYTASNQVTATSDDVGASGAIIDAAVAAGSNLVSGPTLTPSDQLELERRALAAAILDARARAQAVATAAGVRLGAVQTVTEQSSTTPVLPLPEEARAAAAPATPVEAGTIQTEEDITVTFAIA